MRRIHGTISGILVLSTILFSSHSIAQDTHDAWRSLFDGSNLDNFDIVGDANWELVDGMVQADSGSGFLLTKESFGDFQLKLDFWVDPDANSGIFLRCADRNKITDDDCYEANIFDKRPDPSGRTGGIPNFAPPLHMVNAGGQWNTYLIMLKGSRLLIELNGLVTVDAENDKFKQGQIALQYGRGTVKFRKVTIMSLED
jgi:hypothetical protein